MELEELKKGYEKLKKNYKLPSFEELNESFEIGKIDKDNGTLLRTVRKVMMEKVVNSLSFVEMLMNPMNAPRMYLPYIKNMGVEDKKCIDKIYKELADLSMSSLECEVNYDEKCEAELVRQVFAVWKKLGPEFAKVFGSIRKPNNNFVKKERSYFG